MGEKCFRKEVEQEKYFIKYIIEIDNNIIRYMCDKKKKKKDGLWSDIKDMIFTDMIAGGLENAGMLGSYSEAEDMANIVKQKLEINRKLIEIYNIKGIEVKNNYLIVYGKIIKYTVNKKKKCWAKKFQIPLVFENSDELINEAKKCIK